MDSGKVSEGGKGSEDQGYSYPIRMGRRVGMSYSLREMLRKRFTQSRIQAPQKEVRHMSKPRAAKTALEKNAYFRIVGPRGVSPELWTWDGKLEGSTEYRIHRMTDNFSITINPYTLIIPVDMEDL